MWGALARGNRARLVKLFCWAVIALGLLVATAAQATTHDITSQFAITRSALVLNRASNTFDSSVNLKNTSNTGVPAPINAAVSGLPESVTLPDKVGQTSDGKPYLSPLPDGLLLPPGSSVAFALRFSDPERVTFTSILQILYAAGQAPTAPTLLGAAATEGTNAELIGRIDGAPNQTVALQVTSASGCFLGSLVGGAAVGGTINVQTDESGYFAVDVSGVNPGNFVAISLTGSPTSSCLISSRNNDSWPNAFPLDGSPVSVQDFIDAPDKARWYKFAITPGQTIKVVLSNLPADYDLAVFKDIEQVFLAQFKPATATTNDLLKLTAETASATFSPHAFSATTVSPHAFSPDAYSPHAFSDSLYSPHAFSPSDVSPHAFSPHAFSPDTFSPHAFSPHAFSPHAFSSVYSDTEIEQAFSTAQTRSLIALSATPGTGDETAIVNTWNNTGNFYVRVTGSAGAFDTGNPFTLTVTKGPTDCTHVTDIVLTPRAQVVASGLLTVILTDSSVVALDAALPGPGGGTLRDKLTALAARAEVMGVVVDVAGDARVGQLKAQAASNPACPFAKNLVAQEIKGIVDTYRANPLRYVVVAGNDDAIPFFRSPDQSGLGEESAYVPPVQSNSPSEASLRLDFVLSQDRYGSTTDISIPNDEFPVPGLAVGRLVETASEIAGMIDAYVATNGVVVPGSALVTGYDFLADDANAVDAELQAAIGVAPDTLITPEGVSPQDPASWTAAQLAAKLFVNRYDIVFLAGHFSANSALAADFTTSVLTTDFLAAAVDFTNAIIFSAGCHSGYNLVDAAAIPGVTLSVDWAQAAARRRAVLVAGTGYQYGDTDFLQYSELLYLNFARELRAANGAISIGEALAKAKLDYLTVTPNIQGIHEKVLLEATLFGLPMMGVNMPFGRGGSSGSGAVITPALVASGPAHDLGLQIADIDVAPVLINHNVPLHDVSGGPDVIASYLSVGPDGVVSRPGEPTLPLDAVNVTPTDATLVLRGVGFRSGSYADSGPMIPFSGAPTTELRNVHLPFLSPVFYPGQMWNPNYFGALSGSGGTDLLVTPAQHIAASIADGTSTRRQFTDLKLRLFYSNNVTQAALSDAPTITGIDAEPAGTGILFAVQVVGDPSAAIYQVWITYTGEGTGAWASLDLAQCVAPLPAGCGGSEDSRVWTGQLASPPANIQFMAQAVSGTGLVATDDNRGAYYRFAGVASPTPQATELALVSPPTSAAIGDTVNVTVQLSFGGAPVPGKTVIIAVGADVELGTTGADGKATITGQVSAAPGSYEIVASFAGDDVYEPSSTTGSFVVNKAPSTLARLAPAGAVLTGVLSGKTLALQAEVVAFSVTGPGGPATIFVTTDYLGRATLPPPGLPAGNYSVTSASFGGDDTFAPTTVSFSPVEAIVVAKTAQTIFFDPLPDKVVGDPDFPVFATASSGLAVTFGASGTCAIAGSTVHLTGAGSCTITASQPGDSNYSTALLVARTFSIGAPAPTVVSLVRAMPSPTMADSVTYTLTFSEAVTGVATSNFAITTDPITGASVASVSGSGTTWTVTVNTGRGTGTLRLDVANGTGIVDADNVPLAGTPFSGETYDIDKGGTVHGGAGADGQPVPGFGTGGYALFSDVPIATVGGAIAMLSNGRILVAGTVGCDSVTSLCTLQLARYLASGTPDASFGTNGRVVTSVTNIISFGLSGIHVNGDGTFLVGGILNDGTNDVLFVAKFTSAGTPDASFGTNGVTVLNSLPIGVAISGFAVDASGRSVIASSTLPTQTEGPHVLVARLTSAGALDATFGSAGVAQFVISSINDQGRAVAIQSDGKIVVGGRTRGPLAGADFLVLRIDASGALDPTFGTNGVATTRIIGTAGVFNLGRKLVLQPDGKIVLVGNVIDATSTGIGCGIARFNADGTLDAGFGSGGQVLEPRLDQGCINVSLQPDGKTVIVGNASDADVNIGGLLRLLLNGSPDPTFGDNGALGISNYGTPAPVAVTLSGNLLTMLTVEDPADGVIKSYVVELGSTLAAPSVAQSITFNPLPDTTFGEQAFQLDATASSGLTISYTASGACAVSGNTLQIGGVGNCTITASQPGTAFYAAAPQMTRTFNIGKADQVITFGPAPAGVTAGPGLVFVSATSSSPTAPPSTMPITLTSLTPAVCTTDGVNLALVTFVAAGQCMIAANQPGDANYNAAPQATQSFTVGAAGTPPATFTVTNLNDRGAGSLRAAITSANGTAPGPNIVDFAPGLTGTIVLTSGSIQISRSVFIDGPGVDNLTINGNANNRIFTILATSTSCPTLEPLPDYLVLIRRLRLSNGRRNVSDSSGGAIYTEHSLALDSMIIDNNTGVTYGGGVAFWVQYAGQALSITNSQFLNNSATELLPPLSSSNVAGGALSVQDRCTTSNGTISDRPSIPQVVVSIANSVFTDNRAQPATLGGRGGAIRLYSLADVSISDTTIVDNQVDAPDPPFPGQTYHGGGIEGLARSLLIYRSEIAENSVTDMTSSDATRSGGLHFFMDMIDRQGPSDAMAVRIVDSTISGNVSAATAGAILASGNVALELDNTTVNGNSAAPTRTGGIVMSSGATFPVSASNTTAPTLKLVSSILANNSSNGGDVATNTATIPTFAINAFNSLIEKLCASCAIVVSGSFNPIHPCEIVVPGPGNLVGCDPVVGPLAFNGGSTRTHALLAGSPAIDTGGNPLGLTTDQRGFGLPRGSGGAADMGAYEASQSLPISGGTYFSRNLGLIGTSFLFDPVTPSGTLPSVNVTGPPSWNAGNPFSCFRYQPQAAQPVVDEAPFAYFTTASGTLVVVDTATNGVRATVGVGTNPYSAVVNPAGTRVYVSNFGDNTVSVVDASTNAVIATVAVGAGPQGLALNPSGSRVYVASFTAGTVSVIDAGINSVIAAIPAAGAADVVADHTGTRLYVAYGPGVAIVDTATNLVVGSIPRGALSAFGTIAISLDDTRLYAWSNGSASVAVIDIGTSSVVATIPIPSAFANNGIAVDPSGAPVYQSSGSSVSEIDPPTNSIVNAVALGTTGSGVNGVAVTPDGERVYVATANGAREVDTATDTVNSIATGAVRAMGHFIGSGPRTVLENIADRSICWTFTLPITGSYTAQGTAGGTAFTGTVSLDAANQLAALQITSLQVGAGSVSVAWTPPAGAHSFLIRVNPVPFTGITGEKIVSRGSSAATLTGLTLSTGATYQVNVFAFSQDVETPDPLTSVFNVSADNVSFIGP